MATTCTARAAAAASLLALTLGLTACGGETKSEEGAIEAVVKFTDMLAENDYDGACDLIDPARVASSTCAEGVQVWSAEDLAGSLPVTAEELVVTDSSDGGCVHRVDVGDDSEKSFDYLDVRWDEGEERWWIINGQDLADSESDGIFSVDGKGTFEDVASSYVDC